MGYVKLTQSFGQRAISYFNETNLFFRGKPSRAFSYI